MSGRPKKKWTYSYSDIADCAAVGEDVVRQAVKRGILDPSSLRSVVDYVRRHHVRPKLVHQLHVRT